MEVAVAEMADAVAPAEQGSLELIEAIYREHGSRFRRVAAAILGSAEAAEDVVQEAFASAVAKRGSFRGSGAASAWIWRIVVNGALSRRRRGRLERRFTERLRPSREEPSVSDGSFRALVARLPERQRAALFLRYYADLDYDSIAAAAGIERGTVAATLHAAHNALRRTITEAVQ